MRKTKDLIYDLILVAIDLCAIVGGYVAAYAVRSKLYDKPLAFPYGFKNYLRVIILLAPIWIVIFALSGLYRSVQTRSRLANFGQVFLGHRTDYTRAAR